MLRYRVIWGSLSTICSEESSYYRDVLQATHQQQTIISIYDIEMFVTVSINHTTRREHLDEMFLQYYMHSDLFGMFKSSTCTTTFLMHILTWFRLWTHLQQYKGTIKGTRYKLQTLFNDLPSEGVKLVFTRRIVL